MKDSGALEKNGKIKIQLEDNSDQNGQNSLRYNYDYERTNIEDNNHIPYATFLHQLHQEPIEQRSGNLETARLLSIDIRVFNTMTDCEIRTNEDYHEIFIAKCKKQIGKIKSFHRMAQDALKEDFDMIKHLMIENDNFFGEDIMKKLKSFQWFLATKHKSFKDHHEITWRTALIHLYKLVKWLEDCMLDNVYSVWKILCKYKSLWGSVGLVVERDGGGCQPDIKLIEESLSEMKNLPCEEGLRREIVEFYSNAFFKGNRSKASEELEGLLFESISKQNSMICLIILLCIFFLLLATYFIITYSTSSNDKAESTTTSPSLWTFFPSFYFTFMIVLMLIGVGLSILLFEKYRINYIYLLKIDPRQLFSPQILIRHMLILLVIWEILLIAFRLSITSFHKQFEGIYFTFPVINLLIIFFYFFFPFSRILHYQRICLVLIFIRMLNPFGNKRVKFRDFLFADILTSLYEPFAALVIFICTLYCTECKSENQKFDCNLTLGILIVIEFPFALRFLQCIGKCISKESLIYSLINALKYLSRMANLMTSYLINRNILPWWSYLITGTISYLMLVCYDSYIDFNLCHLNSHNVMLRDKLKFPKAIYYIVLVINALIRLLWIEKLIFGSFPFTIGLNSFIFSALEVFRRFQWILIRVENEQLNNLENYREEHFPIPDLPIHKY